MSKISVIGAGSVGATIANDLMLQGVASEIVLVDINKKKAIGEALDIYQGAPLFTPAIVRPGEYTDVDGSDIVIITCGLARKPGMSRLDLAQVNTNILKDIASQVVAHAPNAIYVIVSNPVDVLTYVFHKVSGIPENRIIGSGTILDTSRLQSELAKRFAISPKNVHAHVYGEHGDTSFVPWSLAHIANSPISNYVAAAANKDEINWEDNQEERDEVEEFVKKSGGVIIENKGATFYAVAMAGCHICRCIFSDAGTALTVSAMMHGEYGVEDVCLSTLAMIDRSGIRGKISSPLTQGEVAKLHKSADRLKEVISQLEI